MSQHQPSRKMLQAPGNTRSTYLSSEQGQLDRRTARREYLRQYHRDHKARARAYQRQYYRNHKKKSVPEGGAVFLLQRERVRLVFHAGDIMQSPTEKALRIIQLIIAGERQFTM